MVDISRSEHVETDLDRLIERRDTERRKTEGERLEEELWQESVGRYNALRREENRIAWCAYYRNFAGALYARAEEYNGRAEKLSEEANLGEGPGQHISG
jgi:hypothetical protein